MFERHAFGAHWRLDLGCDGVRVCVCSVRSCGKVLLLAIAEQADQGKAAATPLWVKLGVVARLDALTTAAIAAKDNLYKRKQEAKEAGMPTVAAMSSLGADLILGTYV